MDTDVSTKIAELHGLARAFQDLAATDGPRGPVLESASHYLRKAMEIGAFDEPHWIRFRTDAEQWWSQAFPFISAEAWLAHNAESIGIRLPEPVGEPNTYYWCAVFAGMITAYANILEANHRMERVAQTTAPRNWWKTVNQWWQHNPIATAVVVLVVIIPAIRGSIALYNDLMSLTFKPHAPTTQTALTTEDAPTTDPSRGGEA